MHLIAHCAQAIAKVLQRAVCAICSAMRACINCLRSSESLRGKRPYSLLKSSKELAESQLVFAERSFVIRRPLKLAVRIDRAYDNGKCLILVELKTRLAPVIYQADIIELSAQRLAMHHCTKREVADHGYVLLVHPFLRKQTLHRVELESETMVIALAQRRHRLLAGLTEPVMPTVDVRCTTCEYRAECPTLAGNSSAKLQSSTKSPS